MSLESQSPSEESQIDVMLEWFREEQNQHDHSLPEVEWRKNGYGRWMPYLSIEHLELIDSREFLRAVVREMGKRNNKQ